MTTIYRTEETIAALATPPGEGGIAIIRISGKEAIAIGHKVFSGSLKNYESHTAHLGVIFKEGRPLDQALALVMRAPRSYTGEDVVEFHCHGGMVASKRVLEAILEGGARLAHPGEFTFRAFMNGKLDLAQAEAVQTLIGAKNKDAMVHAERHLAGALSKKITHLQDRLLLLAAILEAWVDFPEEGIEFATQEELVAQLKEVREEIARLIGTFEDGKAIFHGVSLAIVGEPNAGKSSLLNALIDEERAIVTPQAGTTRDLLHEEVTIGGILFRLTDTAGLRETDDVVEQEGIRRARIAAQQADWILAVVDLTRPLPPVLQELPPEKTVVVFNKSDLANQEPPLDVPFKIALSAKTGEGIEELKGLLQQLIWEQGMPDQEEVLLSSRRHKEALVDAQTGVDAVMQGLIQEISPEWLLVDLKGALQALGQVLGQDVTDEVLTKIFSTFCIGK